jgi:hypothetical protein
LPLLAVLLCAGSGGCAAITNPAGSGIPVHRLPTELLATPKAVEQTIPLTLLRPPVPDAYRLAAGDVLGVYVEGFLGDRNQPLPLHVVAPLRTRDQLALPPAAGYPVPVQPDGTLSLPKLGTIPVAGQSLAEAQETIRRLVFAQVTPEQGKQMAFFVTLLHRRQSQVLVFRQETPTFVSSLEGPVAGGRRGTGHVLDLPAYENDVLHALALTGGLPALDAYNAVIIFRDCFQGDDDRSLLLDQLRADPAGPETVRALCPGACVTRIPLRLPAGQAPPLRPEDIVLRTGDVVFLEARDPCVFATGGLLPPGLHVLPRDRDVDVFDAIAMVRGPLFNGDFGGSNLSGALVLPGIGNPSSSLLGVLRRSPDGRQVLISVDLRKAMRDPRERLLVRSGDLLILQETPGESLSRYITQTFFNFDLVWQVFRSSRAFGLVDVAAPDRLPARASTVFFNP